jgi:hypothetical protein
VRPFGPGWAVIREKVGVLPKDTEGTSENIPMALLGWVAGCASIWSSLFTVGNFLYGRNGYGFALLAVFMVSTAVLLHVVNKLWVGNGSRG